ncbi:unnamed protein product [Paramecium primaurelia]|uniref:Uncharacterized protein n=1 Tax=Paramecium primaurelia TaxID=5886 RepID=A0A8S1M682_PARPR|nr:unnamed protein product [Paramecium primaurelia]
MEFKLRNEQMIAYHRNREDYEPQPEDCLQFAYGDRRYVKMTNQIFASEDVLKLKNLEEINEDFHRGDFITLALLSSDILDVLMSHLSNSHEQIRELSSSAIVLISSIKFGRDKIMEKCYVPTIMKLLNDQIVNIRKNGYSSLLNMTEFQQGVDHVYSQGILVPLVNKLVEESVEDLLILDLQLLEKILYCGDAQVEILKTQAIKRLTQLLKRTNFKLRSLACKNLACISYDSSGKLDVINQGCVLELCSRLLDDHNEVITNATMALASLAQHNECKFQMMDNNKLDIVIKLLDHNDHQIKLNSVQLVTSLAEHPKGRKECYKCLPTLQNFSTDTQYEYIRPYAIQAIEVIKWEP